MTVVSDEQPDLHYDTVNVYRVGGAAKIELNRPERMNAWSSSLSADLLSALQAAAADTEVRAVMLTGAGRGFCSGADIKEGMASAVADGKPVDTEATLVDWYNPIVTAIREMPKPVVTAVNGPAAGAGLSLALAGDLVPDGGASLFVPSRIGFARFAEMAMLGEPVTATRAADIGLINAVWPDEEFAERAEALLTRLSNGPTRSYAGTKRELNHWLYTRMPEQLALEAKLQGELGASKDFLEGVAAFLEKRKPTFTGE